MLQNLPIMLFSISQIIAYYAHFYASQIMTIFADYGKN